MNETIRTFSVKNPRALEMHPKALERMRRINNGEWKSDDERDAFLRDTFGEFSEGCYLLEPITFISGANIFLGENVFINSNVTFLDAAPIHIGSHTMIAPGCVLTTVDHPISAKERRGFAASAAPITIGRDVWLGANTTVFPGVVIGDNVVIGANSVVNKDVPSNCVVAGAPVRIIREIEDDTEQA